MADHKTPNHHPRNDDSLPRLLLDLLRKLTKGMNALEREPSLCRALKIIDELKQDADIRKPAT